MPNRTVIFLGDGMADEPVAELNGRTPLQVANTPAMDAIARDGRCGTLLTLPEGFPSSSEVANMSVLGCDVACEYSGRGPLEAAGRGIALTARDIAFRMNFITVTNGLIADYSAGQLDQAVAEELVALLNAHLATDALRFYSGVSYRNLLILSDEEYSDEVITDKPDDNQGEPVAEHLPRGLTPEGERTAALLRGIIAKSSELLKSAPANQALAEDGKATADTVWPWYGGRAKPMRQLVDKHGISGAVISAVDVINGLGSSLGMDVIRVPGATGFIDTNYEGKAQAAIDALNTHDFVYLHVEATDEVSHMQDLQLKIRAIEDFDSRVIGPVLKSCGPELNAVVLPDHPVPIRTGKHTRMPVPVAVRMRGQTPDAVQSYDEVACPAGSLGAMRDGDLMALLFGPPRVGGRSTP